MKPYSFLIVFLVFWSNVYAQTTDSTVIRIKKFSKSINFYTKLTSAFSNVEVSNPDLKESLLFEPNPNAQFGMGFSYSWLGLGFNVELPTDYETEQKYGKTQKFDFEAHYTLRRFFLDFTLKNYKGFYLSNPGKVIPQWDRSNPLPKAPNLETVSLAVSFAYIFSPDKFSANAAYTYTYAMRKSGGSWILGGFASVNTVASDTSIVPGIVKQYIDPRLDVKTLGFANFGVSFGYSYLFTMRKKYFCSLTLLPGLSLQKVIQQSSITGEVTENNVLAGRNIVRFSLGKNGDKYYWGIAAYIESSIVNNKDSKLQLTSGSTYLFLGYRLDTSNWKFMKGVDRVMHPRFLRFLTGSPPER